MIVLLYYKYVRIHDPAGEVEHHRELCKGLKLTGRILIGDEGINGTCCGEPKAIASYRLAMRAHPLFSDIEFKESESSIPVFDKLFVRLRPEIVTLRTPVDLLQKAPYISSAELHSALENNEDVVLIDMRNDYEAAIGRFRNAVTLPMTNFRDLETMLPHLEAYKRRKVITYCTGGIRCEKASALLVKNGFTDVRQLEGGIVNYCKQFPDGHFLGSCFVFDKRLRIRYQGLRPATYLTACSYCKQPSDRYRDCADDSCHALYICCEECEARHAKLCQAHHPVSSAA